MEFPSPINNYHRDTYAAIDPFSSHLSTKGKNVVITGGGSGIGRAIARSFVLSGASSITLLGRMHKTFLETKATLESDFPDTSILTYIADIVDKSSISAAFESIKADIGRVDILIANAGYMPAFLPIAESAFDEWYNGFEVNVKGNFNLV
jgi:NADP-dependent 3-hydroxy acid dehydrogenase YdfG